MADFRPGDKVRVTFEGVYGGEFGADGGSRVHADGRGLRVPQSATVELIERADDPSKDPVGTVRETFGGSGTAYVKVGPNKWISVGSVTSGQPVEDRNVRRRKVIGAVPGTPAAERQAGDELSRQTGDGGPRGFKRGDVIRNKRTGAMYVVGSEGLFESEYYEAVALWTGDGSEEPPEYVKKVRDERGDIMERRGEGWWWTLIDGETVDDPPDGEGNRWGWQAYDGSTFTEVR